VTTTTSPTSPRDRAAARLRWQLRERIVAEGLPELIRVDTAARLADVHKATLWSWIADGLPRIRAGRCTRIPVEELIDWLARRVEVAG